MHGQIQEIACGFHPDLFWFDGDWEHSESEWHASEIRTICEQGNPRVLLNGRLKSYGDYDTPEQNMPVTRPDSRVWELCLTTNDNWGWRPEDRNWKTPGEVIQIFTECLGMGGNLLLDIGPKSDGTIPEEEQQLLRTLGSWTRKHAEAIYGTMEGLPEGHYHGVTSLSKDSTILYLFVPSVKNGDKAGMVPMMIKGLRNKILSATVVGDRTECAIKIVGKISWSSVPGTVFMDLPVQIGRAHV